MNIISILVCYKELHFGHEQMQYHLLTQDYLESDLILSAILGVQDQIREPLHLPLPLRVLSPDNSDQIGLIARQLGIVSKPE